MMHMQKVSLVVVCLMLGVFFWYARESLNNEPLAAEKLNVNLVRAGMSIKEVEMLLGNPENVRKEPENGLEARTYYERQENLVMGKQLAGLTIIYENGVVYKVLPIEMIRTGTKGSFKR